NPKDAEAPILLSATAAQQSDLDEIRKTLNNLPADARDRVPVEIALGNLDLQDRKLKEAEAHYQKAIEIDPKSGAARLALGTYLWPKTALAGAERALSEGVELPPPRSPWLLQIVQFKIRNGDITGARKTLDELTKKTPDFVSAWMLLAEIAATEKKF